MPRLEWLFVVALALYTYVIWYHRLRHRLVPWMVWLFGLALTADLSGTVFLCVVAAEGFSWTLHTITGLASLIIMSVHFTWAVRAHLGQAKPLTQFNRWSVRAWGLWCVAFVSGIPIH